LYANASLVQGLPISQTKFGVRRANSLMAGLRYESKLLEVSLPLSLYEYRYPQVGLAFRFYFLTIGTDKLVYFFGKNNLYGGDIYAHIHIPITYHPACKARVKSGTGAYDPSKIRKGRKHGCEAYL
jgi:hypothetical protein